MNQSFQQPLFLDGSFEDIDQFSEATRAWDLAFRQLEAGTFESGLTMIDQGTVQLLRCRFNRKLEQQGGTPHGMRTFGFLEAGTEGVRWYGRKISDDTFLNFHPTSGFNAVSSSFFEGYTLSVDEETLIEITESLGLDYKTLFSKTECAQSDCRKYLRAFQNQFRGLLDSLSQDPSIADLTAIGYKIQEDIPLMLIELLASVTQKKEIKEPIARRRHAFNRAITFIHDNSQNPIMISRLCEESQVSWRTLDYVFKENFGISPKKYLMAVRLNGVRNALLKADSGSKVVRIAHDWDYWHMGQFAKEYRDFFGELPSETLIKKTLR